MNHPILKPRWTKLLRDLNFEKERMLLMMAAIVVSLIAVGVVLGGYAVLTREIAANYLGTNPAAATLELPDGVDAATLAIAKQVPGINDAEAKDVVLARARINGDWRPMLLFVIDDFDAEHLNTFTYLDGAKPPPMGAMLIERTATGVLNADVGGRVLVKTAHGTAREVPVTGTVHDPGLAPAWQERMGYGYISRATLVALGEAPLLHELRISLNDSSATIKDIEHTAAELARQLAESGHPVHEIRVPPPHQHPHQRQMTTILFMMLAFSLMALVLSGVLTASSLASMLARQVREIGVMKSVGARAGQIAGLYGVLVAGLGIGAVLLAIPIGWGGGQLLSKGVSNLLNFRITDSSVPGWVFAVQALAGVLVPLLIAALPIRRASRVSVREAIQQYGVGTAHLNRWATRLPNPLRNALRRPVRLLLTIVLLAAGGAMFMTALNISASWQRNIAKVYETRHYDVEIRFHEPQPHSVAERVMQVPGVVTAEAWGYSPTAFAKPGEVDVARTYPDRGHASFAMLAPPTGTRLITFPLMAGRWLTEDDTNEVVLNHAAAAQVPGIRVGDNIHLSIDGMATRQAALWRVVGIVEEIGAAGIAYVTPRAFANVAGIAGGARMLRVTTRADSTQARTDIIRAIEQTLDDSGASVELAVPLAELRTAMADHITILIRSLIGMAVVMALVGGMGLASAMGVSVLERTHEFGVMKTLGTTPLRIKRLVIAEGLWIGALSWVAALVLALPLTAVLDKLIGQLGFVAPLPFIAAPVPALLWMLLVGSSALLATWLPARQAGRLTVANALLHV